MIRTNRLKRWLWCVAAMTAGLAGGCDWPTSSPPKASPVLLANASIDARTTLRTMAEDSDPVLRANAIEAMAQTLGKEAGGVFVQALHDKSPAVQFAAAMAIGDTRYQPAKGALQSMAKAEGPDKRVYAAVIYALHTLGDDSRMQDLARLLEHRESEVRADAAMAMGRIGEPSAIDPLKVALSCELNAMSELQLVESLAMLGDEKSKFILESYVHRPFLDERLFAIDAMARTHSERGVPVLRDLVAKKHPPAVRVMAAGALARLGWAPQANYDLCVEGIQRPQALLKEAYGDKRPVTDSDIIMIRRLAALALGWMGRADAIAELNPLQWEADKGLRVAAATSILRLIKGRTAESLAPAMQEESLPPKLSPPVQPVQPTPTLPSEPQEVPAPSGVALPTLPESPQGEPPSPVKPANVAAQPTNGAATEPAAVASAPTVVSPAVPATLPATPSIAVTRPAVTPAPTPTPTPAPTSLPAVPVIAPTPTPRPVVVVPAAPATVPAAVAPVVTPTPTPAPTSLPAVPVIAPTPTPRPVVVVPAAPATVPTAVAPVATVTTQPAGEVTPAAVTQSASPRKLPKLRSSGAKD